jgi:hypothetical protein
MINEGGKSPAFLFTNPIGCFFGGCLIRIDEYQKKKKKRDKD